MRTSQSLLASALERVGGEFSIHLGFLFFFFCFLSMRGRKIFWGRGRISFCSVTARMANTPRTHCVYWGFCLGASVCVGDSRLALLFFLSAFCGRTRWEHAVTATTLCRLSSLFILFSHFLAFLLCSSPVAVLRVAPFHLRPRPWAGRGLSGSGRWMVDCVRTCARGGGSRWGARRVALLVVEWRVMKCERVGGTPA